MITTCCWNLPSGKILKCNVSSVFNSNMFKEKRSNNTHLIHVHLSGPSQLIYLSKNLTIGHQIKWIHEPHEIGPIFSSEIDHCVTCSLISDVTCTFLRQVASCIAHPFVLTICWPFRLHHQITTTLFINLTKNIS